MKNRSLVRASLLSLLPAASAAGGGAPGWVEFNDDTATRLITDDPAVGAHDTQVRDYAWGDVDQDGDTDLVVVRKQGWTFGGGRRNVLFVNEGTSDGQALDGVLVDRTAQYIPDFLDLTNDRDAALVDVNNDTWLDIVTAAACNGCDASGIANDSRLYLNLGAPGGTWLGFWAPTVLLGTSSNNLTAVAAGDVTGDGFADLYFVSHQDNLHDQLLINGGAARPGTFTIENDRLTSQMRSSTFATSAVIADMDGDGWRDIVKTELGRVEIFHNAGAGFFDILDVAYNGAAYHANTGHLNGDGLLDIVVVDDLTDQYLLNQGDGGDGLADFATFAFPNSTIGFGGNIAIADLDSDGHNDVLIADVDAEIPGCARVSDILRNNGDISNPTFAADQGNIPTPLLTGVHDIAVLDIDGDTYLDLVLGRCNGTHVLVQSPPCPWDLGGDGSVGITDLLDLLGLWDTDPGGPPDFDGNGDVGISDLLTLLAHWGPCA